MKSVLIIGSPDSIHTVNFINLILENNYRPDKIDLFSVDHGCDIKDEYADFYKKYNVRIITSNTVQASSRKAKKILYLFTKTKTLYTYTKRATYDYCFVLYCSQYNAMWAGLFANKFKRLVPVFWGGDVLRNTKLNTSAFKSMLKRSYRIVMPNLNAQKVFNERTLDRYLNKTCVIQYPKKMISTLLIFEEKANVQECKKVFNLPENKIIVICGHTATRAENYIQMINQLKLCSKDVLDACYFVFMMTYAPEEYKSYQEEVSSLLSETRLNGVVLKDFITYQDILKLHFASDIHITAIKTDALSCFLQEELFAGSILLFGKWLNYFELENDNFYVKPFNNINELDSVFAEVVTNFDEYRNHSKINRNGIINLASEEAIIRSWNLQIFND